MNIILRYTSHFCLIICLILASFISKNCALAGSGISDVEVFKKVLEIQIKSAPASTVEQTIKLDDLRERVKSNGWSIQGLDSTYELEAKAANTRSSIRPEDLWQWEVKVFIKNSEHWNEAVKLSLAVKLLARDLSFKLGTILRIFTHTDETFAGLSARYADLIALQQLIEKPEHVETCAIQTQSVIPLRPDQLPDWWEVADWTKDGRKEDQWIKLTALESKQLQQTIDEALSVRLGLLNQNSPLTASLMSRKKKIVSLLIDGAARLDLGSKKMLYHASNSLPPGIVPDIPTFFETADAGINSGLTYGGVTHGFTTIENPILFRHYTLPTEQERELLTFQLDYFAALKESTLLKGKAFDEQRARFFKKIWQHAPLELKSGPGGALLKKLSVYLWQKKSPIEPGMAGDHPLTFCRLFELGYYGGNQSNEVLLCHPETMTSPYAQVEYYRSHSADLIPLRRTLDTYLKTIQHDLDAIVAETQLK